MHLEGSLLEYPIPAATQKQIITRLWNTTDHEALRPYFQYYTEQCRIAFHVCGRQIPVQTHQDMLDIATIFQNGLPRDTIKNSLILKYDKGDFPNFDNMLESSIDLAVRITLMLDVGELRNAFSGRRRLVWDKSSLHEFVGDIFPEQIELDHSGIKLGTQFTARNLERVSGFRVELTTNLADHLRLRYEDKTVSVFHHASFLQCQKNCSLFPETFIEETLQTLALLFPQGNRNVEKWYYKQDDAEELDPGVLKCGHLRDDYRQMEKYRFWHDRLVILKEAFDESQPKTLLQLWNDKRDRTQWYTLWVAIGITLFFGLVQSIEGGMQVYKAFQK